MREFKKRDDFFNFIIKRTETEGSLTAWDYSLDESTTKIELGTVGIYNWPREADPNRFDFKVTIYSNELKYRGESASFCVAYDKNEKIFKIESGDTRLTLNNLYPKFYGEKLFFGIPNYAEEIDILNDIRALAEEYGLKSTKLMVDDIKNHSKRAIKNRIKNKKLSSQFVREAYNEHFRNSDMVLFKQIPEDVPAIIARYLPVLTPTPQS